MSGTLVVITIIGLDGRVKNCFLTSNDPPNMQSIQAFNNGVWNVRTRVCGETPYFCGHDIAKALGFANPRKAFQDHVFEEDRLRLQDIQPSLPGTLVRNEGQSVYLKEPGVYALIFGSTKPEARAFKKWVCQDVLPHLRKQYQEQLRAPLSLRNESDLHHKVVQAIRRFWPHALLVAGLGPGDVAIWQVSPMS